MGSSLSFFQNDTYASYHEVSPGGVKKTFMTIETAYQGQQERFSDLSAIITDVPIQESVNANIMYAADQRIFLHVPGDKIGSITISGYTFGMVCPPQNSTVLNQNVQGTKQILEWYRKNRLSNLSSDTVVQMVWSDVAMQGFLGSISLQAINASSRIYQFTLPMFLLPGELTTP